MVGKFPQRARSMHDVAQRCDRNYVRSKDAHKQLARTSLKALLLYRLLFSPQVRFNFRVAFRRSSQYCDQNTISQGKLIRVGSWKAQCISASNPPCNSSEITVGSADYFCTDYSTSEDWTMGGNTFTYTFPATSKEWSVRYVLLCRDD